MNRNDLYISFNAVDNSILERSELPAGHRSEIGAGTRERPRARSWRKGLVTLIAAILIAVLMAGTAMAVSPELRELVFRFFQIEQVQTVHESTADSGMTIEDMYAEPSIAIGETLLGEYVHTPVASLAQDGAFLMCTDRVHTERGSRYDAYYESQGELIRLEEHSFEREYVLRGRSFRIRFDWAEHNGKVITTWIDEDAAFRLPGNGGGPSALLIQLIFNYIDDSGEYIESGYPALLNLYTGELTDALAGTGAEELSWIGNSAISEDLSKMLLCSVTKDGYDLYLADLTSGQLYSIDELSGEKTDSCALTGNKLACWSLTDGYYKVWSIDLNTLQRTELLAPTLNAAITPEPDAGIVYMMGFDSWVHEGNMYAGSVFALEVDADQNVSVIDLATGQRAPIEGYRWRDDTRQLPSSDGRKLLLAQCPDWQDYEYVGVLDFERMTYTEFSRENRQNERSAYWFDDETVVICGELTPESLSADYYLYRIVPKDGQ